MSESWCTKCSDRKCLSTFLWKNFEYLSLGILSNWSADPVFHVIYLSCSNLRSSNHRLSWCWCNSVHLSTWSPHVYNYSYLCLVQLHREGVCQLGTMNLVLQVISAGCACTTTCYLFVVVLGMLNNECSTYLYLYCAPGNYMHAYWSWCGDDSDIISYMYMYIPVCFLFFCSPDPGAVCSSILVILILVAVWHCPDNGGVDLEHCPKWYSHW